MNQPFVTCYEFGPFRLYPLEHLLTHDGESVSLPPKVFNILLLLVRNRGHLLQKDWIIKTIWPDTCVEEGNLSRHVSTLRRILGERRNEHRYIMTEPKFGYRFIATVHEIQWKVGEDGPSVVEKFYALSSLQSIAVLPFKPLTAAGRDESLEMGITDTLINQLSQQIRLTVKPTSAVRQYTDLSQDAVAAGKELGVEAVLESTIQRVGEKIRVSARLLSIIDGGTLWADHFDEIFTDYFNVQDLISKRMAENLVLKFGNTENP